MFQNKHIAQWALYMTICIFVLTACKNEKVIQDKRKDTKTSESTAYLVSRVILIGIIVLPGKMRNCTLQ